MNSTRNPLMRMVVVMGMLALVLWLLGLGLGRSSQAAPVTTFTVNSTDDVDDGACNGAHCSLREAINAAKSGNGADTINFSLPPSATITLGGTQLPAITDTLTIDGGTTTNLTISGDNLSRVFEIGIGTDVRIASLTVADGNSLFGGGIINLGGTLTVHNSTFSGNTGGVTGSGGGIYNSGALTLHNSTFNGNSVGIYGGAIHSEHGTLTVSNSTFSGNTSSVQGGGIGKVGGTLTVHNSTFSGNSADQRGGGIRNLGGTLTVRNSTFKGNSAGIGSGGGINNENGTLHLLNTIIANSPSGGDCVNDGTIGTNIKNLVEDGSCSPAFSGDPLLGPLQNNGGHTLTHAPLESSPAIDNGDDVTCEAFDQRGLIRPSDGDGDGTAVCDIGAVEVGASPPINVFLPVVLKTPG